MSDPEREFWRRRRDALLAEVDAIERLLEMEPRTAELRRQYKQCGKIEIESMLADRRA